MPAFYCENCGKEVSADVRTCPYCGKRFYSVRCPVCSYSGPASDFIRGCPACGYQGPGDSVDDAAVAKKKNLSCERKRKRKKGALPDWVYRIFFVILLVSLVFLIRAYIGMI